MKEMKKQTYSNSIKELEQIINSLESDNDLNMDELNKQVKKASKLLSFCKKELTQINKEVEELINNID
ncbi:MAG: exodeoxyribonuclease VII small subunit [Paludibacter sp.]|nr:MAG: exodeoxyribonuclease VII small subunit [Paludibacter sp.]